MARPAAQVRLPPLPTSSTSSVQNFLMDDRLTDKIVRAAGKISNHYVVEVGPGPGSITRSIIRQCPKKLIVVEKDPRFLPTLELLQEASKQQTEMQIEIGDICNYQLQLGLQGNLPFSVSTHLIIKWLQAVSEKTSAWSFGRTSMTLTFQKEVGERMVASNLDIQRYVIDKLKVHFPWSVFF
nr:unnamed protein product [Callosobruchus analis]CAI5844028.1 unnamed protein product [Callosobruchus analis]